MKLEEYTDEQLKAMAFEVGTQIGILQRKNNEIVRELVKRKAIILDAEVTPDELRDTDSK